MARIKGFRVVLEEDLQEDLAERIRQAILLLPKVSDVVPVETSGDDIFERRQIRRELEAKLLKVLED